jgi:hypothetical protein
MNDGGAVVAAGGGGASGGRSGRVGGPAAPIRPPGKHGREATLIPPGQPRKLLVCGQLGHLSGECNGVPPRSRTRRYALSAVAPTPLRRTRTRFASACGFALCPTPPSHTNTAPAHFPPPCSRRQSARHSATGTGEADDGRFGMPVVRRRTRPEWDTGAPLRPLWSDRNGRRSRTFASRPTCAAAPARPTIPRLSTKRRRRGVREGGLRAVVAATPRLQSPAPRSRSWITSPTARATRISRFQAQV